MKITEKAAHFIYDILVKDAGYYNSDSNRFDFVHHVTQDNNREYRFIGALGFGGKFWNNNNHLYINCYSEDMTPERRTIIDKVNKQLEMFP